MTAPSKPLSVAVIGGGVLGACTAAQLALRRHALTLFDPGGPSASSVAAGMLAPAMEAALEGASPERAALYRHGRDTWPDLARTIGLTLHRPGTRWLGEQPVDLRARLRALDFVVDEGPFGLETPEDWRLDPGVALRGLASLPGVDRRTERIARIDRLSAGWRVIGVSGEEHRFDIVVVATGAGAPPRLPQQAMAAFARLSPVKGQIVRLVTSTPATGPMLRSAEAYVVPADDRLIVGATMEPGRDDSQVDPKAIARLIEAGTRLWPGLDALEIAQATAGVRGASPDGLPIVGEVAPRLFVALAPRRNGWLLGPLVGRLIADAAEGRPPDAIARLLRPDRFDPV